MTAKTRNLILILVSLAALGIATGIFIYVVFFMRIPLLPGRYNESELTKQQAEQEFPEMLLSAEDIAWLEGFYALPETKQLAAAGVSDSITLEHSSTGLPYHPSYENVDCSIKIVYNSNDSVTPIHITADSEFFVQGTQLKEYIISVGFPADHEGGMQPSEVSDLYKRITYKGFDGLVNRTYTCTEQSIKRNIMSYGLADQLIAWWDALMGI